MMAENLLQRLVCYHRACLSREMRARDLRHRVDGALIAELHKRGKKSLTLPNGERIVRQPYFYPLSPSRRRKMRREGSTGSPEKLLVYRGA